MGLILDMGKEVRLSQVMVQFGTICCTHAEIEIGNSDTPTASTLNTFTDTAELHHGRGRHDVQHHQEHDRPLRADLDHRPAPAGRRTANQYQALIYNIVVRGSAAAQSG